ncbi:hypothetical protein [Thermosulfurimonas sp. F29]|uniref:hypothetical protein n=1 Tax=Thermosulfurimonas sp. F29 TaxID=2867247 RepID=UPI001C837954|nr:hypothetical protein [Thermosulfurimonas sp. F29]MBX6422790.1 hypothetical protein [Thermosulfurimonas sp. F29]
MAQLNLKPLAETVEAPEPYFRRWREVLSEFREEFRRRTGREVRLLVFDLILEARAHPSLSDIDVLVLSEKGTVIRPLFLRLFRERHPLHPFEFHFADQKLFEEWYTRFVSRWEEIA